MNRIRATRDFSLMFWPTAKPVARIAGIDGQTAFSCHIGQHEQGFWTWEIVDHANELFAATNKTYPTEDLALKAAKTAFKRNFAPQYEQQW